MEELLAKLIDEMHDMKEKITKLESRNSPEQNADPKRKVSSNIEPDFSSESVGRKRKPTKRDRESFTKFQDLEERLNEETDDNLDLGEAFVDSRSTMISEIIIKEEDKYNVITLYTFRNALEKLKFIRKNSAGGARVKLVHMFSKKALNRMISRQEVLGSWVVKQFKSGTSLLDATDGVIYQLCSDCLRPESIDDYWMKLMEEVKIDRFDKEFQVRNFHLKLMNDALNQVEELEAYDALLRYKATKDEVLLMAPLNYGTKENQGFFQWSFNFFGTMKESMKKGITIEALKEKGLTQPEFFELLREFIRGVGRDSKLLADKEALLKPGKTVEQLTKLLSDRKADRETYFKTPTKTVPFKRIETTAPDEDRFIEESMASLSLVTNYNNRFAKELSDVSGKKNSELHGTSGNTSSEPRVCYEFIRGRCQLGSGCQYSHKPADCVRRVESEFVKYATNAWLSERLKRCIDWNKLEEVKQDLFPVKSAANVRFLSDEAEGQVESRGNANAVTEASTPGDKLSPGSTSGKYMRLQQMQLQEYSEDEDG